MFMAPAGSPLGGGLWPVDPPTGDPSNLSAGFYGDEWSGLKTFLQWVNGDANSWTATGFSTDPGTEPTTVWASASPGETHYETGRAYSASEYWWVRHTRGGTPGDWVGPVQP